MSSLALGWGRCGREAWERRSPGDARVHVSRREEAVRSREGHGVWQQGVCNDPRGQKE